MGATNITLCSTLIDSSQLRWWLSDKMRCCLPDKKLWYQLTRYGDICNCLSLVDRRLWFTESNALEKYMVKSRTALQLLSSRYLQNLVLNSRCAQMCADVQFPPSLYANWLLLRWSFMTRPTCLLYTALSRALAITGVTLIPRKSPFSLGTSTLDNGLVFALFQDSGQEWVDRERFHT